MDENNKQSVEGLKNRVNEKYKALIDLNKNGYEEVESIYSDYSTGLFEQDELNRRFEKVISKYKINDVKGTDALLKRENLKDKFVNRITKTEEYLRRFNELIDKYNKDEIKTVHDLEKRINELSEDYKKELEDLNNEYEVLDDGEDITEEKEPDSPEPNAPNPPDTAAAAEKIEKDRETMAREAMEAEYKEKMQKEQEEKKVFVSDNFSVQLLYSKLTGELKELNKKISFLEKMSNKNDAVDKKALIELRNIEAKKAAIEQKISELNEKEKFSANISAEKTNPLEKIVNSKVEKRDEKISKLDDEIRRLTDERLYLLNNNKFKSNHKIIKLDEKIKTLSAKRGAIQSKQKIVVENRIKKIYRERRKELSAVRSYAKLEYEINEYNKNKESIQEISNKQREMAEKSASSNVATNIIQFPKRVGAQIEKAALEAKGSLMEKRTTEMIKRNNEKVDLEFVEKYGDSVEIPEEIASKIR